MKPLNKQEVEAWWEAKTTKRTIILQRNYRYLAAVLRDAQKRDWNVRDVAADLLERAQTSPEAALLLRDLWEVLKVSEWKWANYEPAAKEPLWDFMLNIREMAFDGEEVLF